MQGCIKACSELAGWTRPPLLLLADFSHGQAYKALASILNLAGKASSLSLFAGVFCHATGKATASLFFEVAKSLPPFACF